MFKKDDRLICVDGMMGHTILVKQGYEYVVSRNQVEKAYVDVYEVGGDEHTITGMYAGRFKLIEPPMKKQERFIVAFGQPKAFASEAEALEFIKGMTIGVEVLKVEWTKIV